MTDDTPEPTAEERELAREWARVQIGLVAGSRTFRHAVETMVRSLATYRRRLQERMAGVCERESEMEGAGGSYSLGWRDGAESCAERIRAYTGEEQDDG